MAALYYAPLTVLYTKVENAVTMFFGRELDEEKKPRVVVVGYGWAASAFVNNLDFKKYRVKVVSSSPARFSQPTMISSWKKNFKPPPHGLAIVDDDVEKAEGGILLGKKGSYNFDFLVVGQSVPACSPLGERFTHTHTTPPPTPSALQRPAQNQTTLASQGWLRTRSFSRPPSTLTPCRAASNNRLRSQ
jgi:hypothetical protein